MVCGLWGFEKHVSFVFYRGSEMSDKHKLFNNGFDNAHNRMIKFTSIDQLNEKKLIAYVKEAVKLNKSTEKKSAPKEIEIPVELKNWLSKNKNAKKFFEGLNYTTRKEIIHLLTQAKQEETRKRRFEKIKQNLLAERKTI